MNISDELAAYDAWLARFNLTDTPERRAYYAARCETGSHVIAETLREVVRNGESSDVESSGSHH